MSAPDPRTCGAGAVSLPVSAAGLTEMWSPRVAARINDVLVKVVKIQGSFVWHDHADTDEAFLVLDGELVLDIRDGDTGSERPVSMHSGDLYVVPRGIQHCPRSVDGATIALLEGVGVVNTGASGGALTAPVDRWLDQ